MKAIHLLCHHNGRSPRNSEEMGNGIYRLGWWDLRDEEIAELRDGFAYLHETSGAKSYSQNRIQGFVAGEGEWSGLTGLILIRQPREAARAWRGKKANQSARENFRIVDADFDSEA